jgi:hypothetical protein
MRPSQNSSKLTGISLRLYYSSLRETIHWGELMRNSFYRRSGAQLLAGALAVSQLWSQAAMAQQNIGDTQVVVNDVRGIVGKRDPAVLRAGIDVFQDEIIRTGERSASRVRFQDNTNLSVGAGSEVTLDRFVFDPDPEKSQVALSIAKGVVRFATGSLPKSAYKITTPTATIGVRGTILTVAVADDGTTTVSVEEGIALVSAAGITAAVNAGMTTSATPGSAPSTPSPTPPASPAPIAEMDDLLSQNDLAPGPSAGHSAADLTKDALIPLGIAAVILTIVAITAGNGHSTPSTTSTH